MRSGERVADACDIADVYADLEWQGWGPEWHLAAQLKRMYIWGRDVWGLLFHPAHFRDEMWFHDVEV